MIASSVVARRPAEHIYETHDTKYLSPEPVRARQANVR
jgi:hypothetical protein